MRPELSLEKQELITKNRRLIYYLVHRMGVMSNSPDYEDIVSVGKIGLVKAVITFDPSKEVKFASYASKCINNEIFMYFRKANKYANDISLEEGLGGDDEGNEIKFKDKLEAPESNFVENFVDREDFVQLINILLNYLKEKERLVMLYRVGNLKQASIAKILNISRSYVARIEQKSIKKIKEVFNEEKCYQEFFTVSIHGETYKISFSTKFIKNFNKFFATFLQNIESVMSLPAFKLECKKERIVIQLAAYQESFVFIAKIIQQFDNFSMEVLPVKETVHELPEDSEMNDRETYESGSQIKQVREYMLNMSSFTNKQLKEHFPNMSSVTIANAIQLAKKKGLISSIARGEYMVNKT